MDFLKTIEEKERIKDLLRFEAKETKTYSTERDIILRD